MTVNYWRKCMAVDFPGGKFFYCDGDTLSAV